MKVTYNKVYYFLLADEFKEPGVDFGRVSYVVTGRSMPRHEFDAEVESVKALLISDSDDGHTRLLPTYQTYKEMYGIITHIAVLHFRVRDGG